MAPHQTAPSRELAIVVVTALAFAGCGASPDEKRPVAPRPTPAASTHVDPLPEVPAAQQRLAAAVEALSEAVTDDRGTRIDALNALADCLEASPISDAIAADELRTLAAELGQLPRASLDAGPLLLRAFTTALAALAASTAPASTSIEYRRALANLGRAVEEIGSQRSLTYGADQIVAFRAATDAVFLVGRHAAPFRVANPSAPPPGRSQSYRTELAEARRSVLELAEAPWTDAHLVAARSLTSLADVVELVDGCDRSSAAETLRFEARRIRWARAAGVIHSASIKRGLATALDVIEDGAGSVAARRALANVDANASFTFQRTAVQDAFRALINVFASLPAPSTADCRSAARSGSSSR